MSTSEDFWKSISYVIAAIAGGIVLILKELRTSADIRKGAEATQKNTEVIQHSVEETAKIREDIDAGLVEARKVTANKLRISRSRRQDAEERLRKSEADRIEADRVAAVRLAIEETKRITAEQLLKQSQAKIEELSAEVKIPEHLLKDDPDCPDPEPPISIA